MRMNASLISLLTGIAVAGVLAVTGWTFAAPGSGAVFADKRPNAVPVDVELVLAVDVSYSMDPEEQALQREGYITGITSRDFMQALRGGQHGKVAMTYFEWAGPYDQKIVVPWRLIDGPESADAFANEIARAPYRRASRTSISGALNFAKPLFDASGFGGFRRVIDVSGDGANNSGPFVTIARDDVLAAGLTINGLPIMLKRPNSFHGCREPRRVLRGLRDRRPRCIRHPNSRTRPVQGGDPHQARAGNRRPHTRAAGGTGPGEGAPGVLHHRRADVAGALGKLDCRRRKTKIEP